MAKSAEAFRTISEVATDLDVPQHVLRFWETKFSQIKPLKRGGGRRYYRPEDIDLLRGIRALLYTDGFTIKGVQKVLREQGVRTVAEATTPGAGATLVGRTKSQKGRAAPALVPPPPAPAMPAPAASPRQPMLDIETRPAKGAANGKAVQAPAGGLASGQAIHLTAVLERLHEAKAILERRRATRVQAPHVKARQA